MSVSSCWCGKSNGNAKCVFLLKLPSTSDPGPRRVLLRLQPVRRLRHGVCVRGEDLGMMWAIGPPPPFPPPPWQIQLEPKAQHLGESPFAPPLDLGIPCLFAEVLHKGLKRTRRASTKPAKQGAPTQLGHTPRRHFSPCWTWPMVFCHRLIA